MAQLIEFAGNHLILVGAFFFVLTMLITNLVQAGVSQGLTPAQAVRLINTESAQPLDVRSSAEFGKGHIINAINVPVAELKDRDKELKKIGNTPILVYCATGTSAATAVRSLKTAGYTNLYTLKGGVSAWQTENLPLTKD